MMILPDFLSLRGGSAPFGRTTNGILDIWFVRRICCWFRARSDRAENVSDIIISHFLEYILVGRARCESKQRDITPYFVQYQPKTTFLLKQMTNSRSKGEGMLQIDNLHVSVKDKEVLHDINLHINDGETHVLMGPNGSGKTTLLRTIMGFSNYDVTDGSIIFKGHDVTNVPLHERARYGMGMMFQRPPTISGLKLGKLLDVTANHETSKVQKYAEQMNMVDFLDRDINADFSGGEIKRSEMLQLMVQQPDFVMLDEPESGVDLENISLIGSSIAKLVEKDRKIVNRHKSGLIITHTGYILDYLDADMGHMLCDGVIRCNGNPREILKLIKEKGYQECIKCQRS